MNEPITITYEPVAPSAKIINRKLFNLCALSVKLIKNANWFSLLLCTHEGTPHLLKQRHHNCNNRKWLCMEWSFWAWTGTYREFLYSPYIIDDLGLALRNIPPRWLQGFNGIRQRRRMRARLYWSSHVPQAGSYDFGQFLRQSGFWEALKVSVPAWPRG